MEISPICSWSYTRKLSELERWSSEPGVTGSNPIGRAEPDPGESIPAMITILPYQPRWPQEFAELGAHLRHALGDWASRVDHIGSTAVPGLAAKDVIDIQITVHALDPGIATALNGAGFFQLLHITRDHQPLGLTAVPDQWQKWLFKPPVQRRPVNVHVRLDGRANQRYALLFRDYLRVHPQVAQTYSEIKKALARYHPEDDMDVYYEIKDPVCDIIMSGAELWAGVTKWQPGLADS